MGEGSRLRQPETAGATMSTFTLVCVLSITVLIFLPFTLEQP